MVYKSIAIIQLMVLIKGLIAIEDDQIPPEGLDFQLQNKQTEKCIFTEHETEVVGHGPCDIRNKWFNMIDFNGETFRLKHRREQKCLYTTVNGAVGVDSCELEANLNQWWTIINYNGEYFRLQHVKYVNYCIFSNDDELGVSSCGSANQWWKFLYEDYEVYEVYFELDSGAITDKTPMIVGNTECDNYDGGSSTHTITLEVSKDVSETSSFTFTTGFQIETGYKIEMGFPGVFKGEVATTLTASTEFEWGEEKTTTKHYGASFEVSCAEGEVIQAEASVWTATLSVPYTIIFRTINTGVEFYSSGVWRGTTSWELRCDYTEITEV